MQDWSVRLNLVISELGWSHHRLATKSGVSDDNVNKYTQGRVARPREPIPQQLADALGVSKVWLMDGVGDRQVNGAAEEIPTAQNIERYDEIYDAVEKTVKNLGLPLNHKDRAKLAHELEKNISKG